MQHANHVVSFMPPEQLNGPYTSSPLTHSAACFNRIITFIARSHTILVC